MSMIPVIRKVVQTTNTKRHASVDFVFKITSCSNLPPSKCAANQWKYLKHPLQSLDKVTSKQESKGGILKNSDTC